MSIQSIFIGEQISCFLYRRDKKQRGQGIWLWWWLITYADGEYHGYLGNLATKEVINVCSAMIK